MSIQCQVCLHENSDEQITCTACGSPLVAEQVSYHLPSGTILTHNQNKYRVDKTLGVGGFGITYKGINLKTNQPVAIKETWPENGVRQGTTVIWPYNIKPQDKNEQIAQFITEGKYIQQFNHPHIVKVYDFFTANDTAYIIMEFLPGKTLYQSLQEKGRLSEELVKQYFRQIADALKTIHSYKLLHRDIKPENIIVNENDKAVLIDFGNAREFIAHKTQTMTQIVTPGYAPLEQYGKTGKRGAPMDIYALCASMYELLTGKLPAAAPDRVNGETLIAPRQIVSTISPLLERIILTGLNMKAEERFPTVDALIQGLQGKYISPLHVKAKELAKENKLSEAVNIYRQCLNNDPDNGDVAVELAMVLIHVDDRQAETAANIAIKLNPSDGSGYGVLGLVNCRQGNWQEAFHYLQKAVSLSPRQSWIQANLAWALGKLGKWPEAEKVADQALQLDSQSGFILSLQAWINANLGQWKNTIRYARLGLFHSKGEQNLQKLQSWVYPCLLLALDQAIITQFAPDVDRCLEEFINLLPNSAFAWGFQGWKQKRENLWTEALFSFTKASQLTPSLPWVLFNLGIIQENLQHLPDAIATYEKYQEKWSKSSSVFFRLGTLSGRMREWSIAKSYLEKAIELNPDYAEAYHNLGWVLLNSKNEYGDIENPRQLISNYRQACQLYRQQSKLDIAQMIEQAFHNADIQLSN